MVTGLTLIKIMYNLGRVLIHRNFITFSIFFNFYISITSLSSISHTESLRIKFRVSSGKNMTYETKDNKNLLQFVKLQ